MGAIYTYWRIILYTRGKDAYTLIGSDTIECPRGVLNIPLLRFYSSFGLLSKNELRHSDLNTG